MKNLDAKELASLLRQELLEKSLHIRSVRILPSGDIPGKWNAAIEWQKPLLITERDAAVMNRVLESFQAEYRLDLSLQSDRE